MKNQIKYKNQIYTIIPLYFKTVNKKKTNKNKLKSTEKTKK